MAVVVARMVASLEAETSQFHARMTAAEGQLSKWSSATVSGRRSMVVLNSAMQQLAFQAAGIPGPLGKAAASIGVLGLGTGPVMLGVAALGALALAFQAIAKHTQEASKAQDDFLKTLTAVSANARALVERNKLQALEAQRDTGSPVPAWLVGPMMAAGVPLPGMRGENRTALESRIASQSNVASLAERAAREANEARLRDVQEIRRQSAEAALEALLSTASGRAAFMGGTRIPVKGMSVIGETDPVGKAAFTPEKFAPREFFLSDLTKDGGKTPPPGFRFTPEFAAMSAMALMQGAQSGSVGGFLGAASGPVAMVNPLAGAITAGLGQVFGIFNNDEERRHRELVDSVKKLGQEVGLDRVTVVFTGADGHQVRKTLAELEAGDAVERVPGPVGAQG